MNVKQTELKRYIRKIKEGKAKITPQRIDILNIFLNNKEEHYTADGIIKELNDSSIGQATVYRTLELFCQLGILKKVNFKNEEHARYDLMSLDNKHFHHHLVCEKCGKVIEFDVDLLEQVEDVVQREYHFLIKNHELIINGICFDCRLDGEENE